MQTALSIAHPFSPAVLANTKTISYWPSTSSMRLQSLASPIKAASNVPAQETSTVDYSSLTTSVFPAEACETVGGEACDVEMYPEVKLNPNPRQASQSGQLEPYDRDYLEYDSPKTVFLEEACDDLGGEFCEAEYQAGPN